MVGFHTRWYYILQIGKAKDIVLKGAIHFLRGPTGLLGKAGL